MSSQRKPGGEEGVDYSRERDLRKRSCGHPKSVEFLDDLNNIERSSPCIGLPPLIKVKVKEL